MSLARLKSFVTTLTRIAQTTSGDEEWLDAARPALAALVAVDDWLSVLSTVSAALRSARTLFGRELRWGPGQRTLIRDHTVWDLIGMLRGEEISTRPI